MSARDRRSAVRSLVLFLLFILAFTPLSMPTRPAIAYLILLPTYATCFWLGWARFKVAGPVGEDVSIEPIRRRTVATYASIPALGSVILAITAPSGWAFDLILQSLACLLVFLFGARLSSLPDADPEGGA